MWNSTIFRWLAIGILGTVCMVQMCSSGEKQQPTAIRAEDLCNGKYVIIGRLGKPYGEISKVRAVWESRAEAPKPTGPSLRITHIDGKKLADDQQIVVDGRYVELRKEDHKTRPVRNTGQVVEGRVFESGGFPRDYPNNVREALGLPPVQPAYGFAFNSFLHFID
jgi:hypothetical protein